MPAIRTVHPAFRDIPESAHMPGAPPSYECAVDVLEVDPVLSGRRRGRGEVGGQRGDPGRMLGEQAERLDVEGEPGRGPRGPRRRGLLGGQRIVGRIHLDQRELAGVIPQPPVRRVRLRRVPARIDQGGLWHCLPASRGHGRIMPGHEVDRSKDASEPLRDVSVPQESRCQPGRIGNTRLASSCRGPWSDSRNNMCERRGRTGSQPAVHHRCHNGGL